MSVECCNGTWTANLFSDRDETNSTSGIFPDGTTQTPVRLNLVAGYKLQIVSFIIGTVGFFLNIFVVVIIALYRPIQKQLTNIIIANQSAMDAVFAVVLVVGAVYPPDPNKILETGNVADEILCRVWFLKTPLWGMLISTTYGIVLLTFDRYLAVVHPIYYKTKIANNKILRILVLTALWFFGPLLDLCLKIPLGNITADHTCNMYYVPNKMVSQIVGLCTVIIDYFFPLGFFIFCYSRMAWVLHRRVGHASDSGGQHTRNESMARARSNVFKTMALVSLFFVLCWTMSQMYWFLFNLGVSVNSDSDFYNFTVAMIFINCCTTPIIYIVKYESFRKGIRHVFFRDRIHPTNDDIIYPTNDNVIRMPPSVNLFNGVANMSQEISINLWMRCTYIFWKDSPKKRLAKNSVNIDNLHLLFTGPESSPVSTANLIRHRQVFHPGYWFRRCLMNRCMDAIISNPSQCMAALKGLGSAEKDPSVLPIQSIIFWQFSEHSG